MRLMIIAVIALAVAACASIGRPDGGPRDETPPVFVRSNPSPGTLNYTDNRIEIIFDENIKIEDAANKVVVSPAQQLMTQISGNGKKVSVILRDSLIPDQTYTIDFGDAIRDLNEGNILDGFVVDFSTGDSIDTLRISGMVLQAETLEPAQGILVGAYRNFTDSAISTIKFERICKTNQYGQFTLRNLKNEYYRIFAINDLNRDYHWDRSEDIAFYTYPVKPYVEHFTVVDTLRAEDGNDSIATRPGIRFLPNNILLTWFNENYVPLYMQEHTRQGRNIIRLEFSTAIDSLPVLTVINGENEGKIIGEHSLINKSQKNDTLEYWLLDSALIMQDSLLIETRYLKTDTNNSISWTTDTIRYFFRESKAALRQQEKKEKERQKKEEKRLEALKKWHETGDSSLIPDTVPEPEPIELINIKAVTGTKQDYHRPVKISFSEPILPLNRKNIHLEWTEDTVWNVIDNFSFIQDSTGKIMEYILDYPWQFETKYKLTIDSASVLGISRRWNKEFIHEFNIKGADEYSTLIFDIQGNSYLPEPKYNWDSLQIRLYENGKYRGDSISLDSISTYNDSIISFNDSSLISYRIDTIDSQLPQIVVQLLNGQDVVVTSAVVNKGKARFDFLPSGTYYARAFIDFNNDTLWTTGNISQWRQPEDVFYYPKKINLKQNWDMSQNWKLFELPLDMQKPLDIKKNRPKTKEAQRYDTDEEDEENMGNNYFYPGTTYGNGSQYNNAQNNRNSHNTTGLKKAQNR